MSTQEKLHGLGIRVPLAYAKGICKVREGDGTAADTEEAEEATGCVPHRPQVAVQLVLQAQKP